ncbi:ABC transporter substrate-binding protein [Rhodococcus erythropolis]|uniref:ABC transporter substrate-binding protein n=1 Tax=Rhodococcus erythropolis TaxID=1833 RepID=UPI00294A6097|nr:ABC transporter substrate-binding protein [Rhodococcus erythropolis]MDV6277780.1 ABC transporter substrate-binding protein [Rhodococcus erythropolis]
MSSALRIAARAAATLATVTLATASLVGCATTGGTTAGGGNLTMALTSDPKSFDPPKGTAASDYTVARLLNDSLVRREGNTVLPGIAQSWELTADRAVFTLRKDITCSNGKPLTPAMTAASLNRLADPSISANTTAFFGAAGATVTADDASGTVTVQLSRPWSDLLYSLALPQAGITCSTDPGALQSGQAPGTGAYTLTSSQRGASYTFSRREDYHWGAQYADMPQGETPKTLTANIIQSEATIANQINTGAVDYASLTGPDADRFRGGDYTTKTAPAINFMIMFNQRPGRPGADPMFRRAVAQAIDVTAFDNAAARGQGQPLVTIAGGTAPCVNTDAGLLVPPNPQEANKVLSGTTVKVIGTNAVAGGAGNAYVQAALEQAGATAELTNADNATWASDVMGGTGDWDLTVFPHLNMTNTLGNAGGLFAGAPTPQGRNAGAVDNAEFTAAMGQAMATVDTDANCSAWAQAQRALLEQVDVIPLTAAQVSYIFSQRAAAAAPGRFVDVSTLVLTK